MNLKDKYHYFNDYVAVLKSYNVYEHEQIEHESKALKKKKNSLYNYYSYKFLATLVIIYSMVKIINIIANTSDFPLFYLTLGTVAGWCYYYYFKKANNYHYQIRQSEKRIKGGREHLRLLFLNHHFRRALIATSYALQQDNVMHINDYRYLQDTIINQTSDKLYAKILELETHMHIFLDNLETSSEKLQQDEKNREQLMSQLFNEDSAPVKSNIYKPVFKVIRS